MTKKEGYRKAFSSPNPKWFDRMCDKLVEKGIDFQVMQKPIHNKDGYRMWYFAYTLDGKK